MIIKRPDDVNTPPQGVPAGHGPSAPREAFAHEHGPAQADAAEAEGSSDFDGTAESGLVAQVGMMLRASWASPVRGALISLIVGTFLVVAATAYGQIKLNTWNQPFYDALSHKNLHEFWRQLGVFGVIAGALLALNVGQRWLVETLKLKLREGLMHDLVQGWLVPGRAFRLAHAGAMGVNPDQRMHEDARHLTELSGDLGVGLLQASILLASFISVLWGLSSNFAFHAAGRAIVIPGYMVWAAVLYSGSASLLSYWVGRSLIRNNANRYAREADLRFSLVRVNEHIDAIALARAEPDEERRIDHDLSSVLKAMRLLVTGNTRLTWVTAGYGWFTLVAPILVAAPLYFEGTLTFGGLMMASGAFMQVQSSLRWFVDNFSTLADWRATLLRVANFRRAVITIDVLHDTTGRIEFIEGKPGIVTLDNLAIASPAGGVRLKEPHVEIQARRACARGRTIGDRQDPAVPRPRGLVAVGLGTRDAPGRRIDAVHAANPIFSTGHAARSARLPCERERFHRRGVPACARATRARTPRVDARCARPLGSHLDGGRAAQPRLRERAVARAALARHRRGTRGARG